MSTTIDNDINTAVSTVENAEKDVTIPDKVTITVGDTGYQTAVDTTNVSKIKSLLPYVVVVVWWVITVLANKFSWSIPFTNQEFTDWLTLGVSLVLTVYTTWKDNPITDKSNAVHNLGEEVLSALSKISIVKEFSKDTSTEAPTTVEVAQEDQTTVAPK